MISKFWLVLTILLPENIRFAQLSHLQMTFSVSRQHLLGSRRAVLDSVENFLWDRHKDKPIWVSFDHFIARKHPWWRHQYCTSALRSGCQFFPHSHLLEHIWPNIIRSTQPNLSIRVGKCSPRSPLDHGHSSHRICWQHCTDIGHFVTCTWKFLKFFNFKWHFRYQDDIFFVREGQIWILWKIYYKIDTNVSQFGLVLTILLRKNIRFAQHSHLKMTFSVPRRHLLGLLRAVLDSVENFL